MSWKLETEMSSWLGRQYVRIFVSNVARPHDACCVATLAQERISAYCAFARRSGTIFETVSSNFTSLAMLAECWSRRCP